MSSRKTWPRRNKLKKNTMYKTVLFPGSFNPFTIGHADIVERGLALFDNLVIAVGYNEQKAAAPVPADSVGGAFPAEIEARLAAIRTLYQDEPRSR